MEAPVSSGPPAPAAADRSGCARKALAGCGITGLLLLAVVVGLFLYVRRNPATLTDLMMKEIQSRYGPDVTDQDKAELRSAYQDFRAALMSGRAQRSNTSQLQFTLSSRGSGRLDHSDVQKLARIFREGAGSSPPAREPSPSPVPSPGPTP